MYYESKKLFKDSDAAGGKKEKKKEKGVVIETDF